MSGSRKKEEREILRAYERGEFQPVKNAKSEKKRYQRYARAFLKKDKRVNIRLSTQDLQGIQLKAFHEGIPYQTLMASVIHKYVTGSLISRNI